MKLGYSTKKYRIHIISSFFSLVVPGNGHADSNSGEIAARARNAAGRRADRTDGVAKHGRTARTSAAETRKTSARDSVGH